VNPLGGPPGIPHGGPTLGCSIPPLKGFLEYFIIKNLFPLVFFYIAHYEGRGEKPGFFISYRVEKHPQRPFELLATKEIFI
jgi:hypothetical protein